MSKLGVGALQNAHSDGLSVKNNRFHPHQTRNNMQISKQVEKQKHKKYMFSLLSTIFAEAQMIFQ